MTNIPPSLANLRGAVDLSSLVRPPAGRPGAASPTAADPAPGGPAASTAGSSMPSARPDGPAGVSQVTSPGTSPAPTDTPLQVPSLVLEATDASFTALLDLSAQVPVVVEIHMGGASAVLAELVRSFAGRLVLATVDAGANPQLQQAFQATVVPTVAAVVSGRPLALYEGELPAVEARQVFEQLLVVAAQNGVSGRVAEADQGDVSPAEPAEQPLPPHHQAAYDAIDSGDFEAAMGFYRTAIAQDPRDLLAVAGLAQVSLLHRLSGTTADAVRAAALSDPADVRSALAAADLDVSGGHLDDAFARLLDLFGASDAADKNEVRTRLLEYFEIAGADDPRVAAARRRLTMLLY